MERERCKQNSFWLLTCTFPLMSLAVLYLWHWEFLRNCPTLSFFVIVIIRDKFHLRLLSFHPNSISTTPDAAKYHHDVLLSCWETLVWSSGNSLSLLLNVCWGVWMFCFREEGNPSIWFIDMALDSWSPDRESSSITFSRRFGVFFLIRKWMGREK
jgi:hypothetical protein